MFLRISLTYLECVDKYLSNLGFFLQIDHIIGNQLSVRLLDSIRVPKFKMEFHSELIPFLQTMGIKRLFSTSGKNKKLLHSQNRNTGQFGNYPGVIHNVGPVAGFFL